MEQLAARSLDCASPSPGSYVHQEPSDHPAPPHGKGRAAMIWGVGSTVLSVVGFLAWGLFEQYNSSLAELRADLKHFNETSGLFVKKDTLTRFREQFKTQFAELQSMSASNKLLDAELKASERTREEMHRELIRIRERLAFVEGRQSAPRSVRASAPTTRPDEVPAGAPLRMSPEE